MALFVSNLGLTSVWIRGLLVPHTAIAEALARSTRPLLFENDDPKYQYSKRGSCTLLSSARGHFAVFGEHQRRDYPPDAIRIVQRFSGGRALAANIFVMVNARGGEEIGDLRALKISPDHHTPEDLSDFFPLSGQQLPPIDSARMLIAVGMPTQTSRIDYAPAHIHADTVPVACLYEPRQTSVRELHTVRIDPRQTSLSSLDLDGMSGAPVFSIDGGPGNYAVNFRGTILRGGNGYLHYIDAALIRRVLES